MPVNKNYEFHNLFISSVVKSTTDYLVYVSHFMLNSSLNVSALIDSNFIRLQIASSLEIYIKMTKSQFQDNMVSTVSV